MPGVNGGQTIQKSECKTSSPTHPAPRPDTEHSHSSQAAPWARLAITLCTEVVVYRNSQGREKGVGAALSQARSLGQEFLPGDAEFLLVRERLGEK